MAAGDVTVANDITFGQGRQGNLRIVFGNWMAIGPKA